MINKEEPAWKKLCKECSSAAKEVGISKEDTDRIIQETRKMQWKANKYDELIEKLEEDIDELETLNDNYTDADIFEGIYTTRGQIIKAKEILSILKGD